jgi:hypothetical protein
MDLKKNFMGVMNNTKKFLNGKFFYSKNQPLWPLLTAQALRSN